MNTKNMTIAVVSLVVAILLITGIVVPIVADATKSKETTEWIEHTGEVPDKISSDYYIYANIDNMIDESHEMYPTIRVTHDPFEPIIYIELEDHIQEDIIGLETSIDQDFMIIYADSNAIFYIDGGYLSMIDLTENHVFTNEPLYTDYANMISFDIARINISDIGNEIYYEILNYDTYENCVTVSLDLPTYIYVPSNDDVRYPSFIGGYGLFNQNPDIIPPTNPNPPVSVGDTYIGLIEGTYQVKTTITEEPPISVRMLFIIPILMVVGLVIGATGAFLRRP